MLYRLEYTLYSDNLGGGCHLYGNDDWKWVSRFVVFILDFIIYGFVGYIIGLIVNPYYNVKKSLKGNSISIYTFYISLWIT